MPKKPLTAAQKQKREEQAFARRIRTVFKNAGFAHLPTEGIERKFGTKTGELDNVFVYENIVLVCEDTIKKASKDVKDHLKNKKLLFDEIAANRPDFIKWLKDDFKEHLAAFDTYTTNRYKIFFLHFPKYGVSLDDDDRTLFSPIKIVEPSTLNYFQKMAHNIRLSSRADMFRYLELKAGDIGTATSGSSAKQIEATIIYPDDSTGLQNGVKIVSFMLAAQNLLDNAYVLRKDNWEDSIQLYQRLIERDRIQKIRKYLSVKKTSFINNIIVSLPPGTKFEDDEGNAVDPTSVENFAGHKMLIPDELNSICVIDGQHRIYAHYEGTDVLEPEIAVLRKKFHLLVTGLIFPSEMDDLARRKFESEIFLDINSEAKQVPPDVLLFIETLKDPFSALGISRQVLNKMNNSGVFKGLFQMSLMEESRIKTASIIKFALRYLVELNEDEERPSLFAHWADEEKRAKLATDQSEALLDEYVSWCAATISQYFGAVKQTFKSDWDDEASKILSTTSINGFLIALRRSLPVHGVKDFAGYVEMFKDFKVAFDREGFDYTSSQYAKFSRRILQDAMGIQPEDKEASPADVTVEEAT